MEITTKALALPAPLCGGKKVRSGPLQRSDNYPTWEGRMVKMRAFNTESEVKRLKFTRAPEDA
jgi:hypothetical protein